MSRNFDLITTLKFDDVLTFESPANVHVTMDEQVMFWKCVFRHGDGPIES